MEKWNGKIAVVTGASSGIGAAIAKKLVENGVKVIGLARRLENIQKLSENLPQKDLLHGLRVDVTKTDELLSAFKKIDNDYGAVHILVNNAGILANTTLMDGDIEKWKRVFDVNVLALCVATREAIANMRKHNVHGHIIHINSLSGHRIPSFLGQNVYPASKHAVTALTECLRLELVNAGSKIRVTSISPGMTDTEIFDAAGTTAQKANNPPLLQAEDVADAAIYALSAPSHVQIHEVTMKPVGAGP